MKKALIVSMGFNGYQWIHKRKVASQRAYAERYGFEHVMVSSPSFTNMRMECTWLKIPLMMAALDGGCPWVLYLDCDVEVKPRAPSFLDVEVPGKDLFLAKGTSGRLNAGVILAKNTERVLSLLSTIFMNATNPVPPEDDVGWGDNGHVIHFAKNYEGLCVLDPRWNNNHSTELDDYFRHYSAGPMRKIDTRTFGEEAIFHTSRVVNKAVGESRRPFYEFIERLVNLARARHPYSFPGQFDRFTGRSRFGGRT